MGLSLWQILIVVFLVVVLFGRGKISSLMGDMAQGIKAFKKGMNDDEPSEDLKAPNIAVDHKPDTQEALHLANQKHTSSVDKV